MTNDAIVVDDLEKVYTSGSEEVAAVDGVSTTISQGEVVGVLGPNGAGKTTVIKTILGLITPSRGSVSVCGVDPHQSPREIYSNVSAVLEGARNIYWRLTVYENFRFFAGIQGRHPNSIEENTDRILAMLDIEDKKHEVVRNLSRGMKQKVGIGCALIRDAQILSLDEPTLGLDVQTAADLRTELTRLAQEEDKTLVICSHNMDVIQEVCDRVIILNEGKIIADSSVENFVNLFGTQMYSFVLEAGGSLDRLRDRNECEITEQTDDHIHVDVLIPQDDSIYDIMDLLRDADMSIQRMESKGTTLETAFMNVLDKDNEADDNNMKITVGLQK